jgi:hypothetical protein
VIFARFSMQHALLKHPEFNEEHTVSLALG